MHFQFPSCLLSIQESRKPRFSFQTPLQLELSLWHTHHQLTYNQKSAGASSFQQSSYFLFGIMTWGLNISAAICIRNETMKRFLGILALLSLRCWIEQIKLKISVAWVLWENMWTYFTTIPVEDKAAIAPPDCSREKKRNSYIETSPICNLF